MTDVKRFTFTPLPMAVLKTDPTIKADRLALAAQWRRMRAENRLITNLVFRRSRAAELTFMKQGLTTE